MSPPKPYPADPSRWWARPLFGVLCFGMTWPIAHVVNVLVRGDPDTISRDALMRGVVMGVVQGLIYGLGGNWLVASSAAEKSPAPPGEQTGSGPSAPPEENRP